MDRKHTKNLGRIKIIDPDGRKCPRGFGGLDDINILKKNEFDSKEELFEYINKNDSMILTATNKAKDFYNILKLENVLLDREVIQIESLLFRDEIINGTDQSILITNEHKDYENIIKLVDRYDYINKNLTSKVVVYKIGSKVMITKNINISKGVVNGSLWYLHSMTGDRKVIKLINCINGEEFDLHKSISPKFRINRFYYKRINFPITFSIF